MLKLTFRPAKISDIKFLLELRISTMELYLKQLQINPTSDDHLKRILYLFDEAQIVLYDNMPIGLFKVKTTDTAIEIIQIQVMPEFQNTGIGTNLILRKIRQATLRSLKITLAVLKVNPALQLYRKLGFIIKSEDEYSYQMVWNPPAMETSRFRLRCFTTADAPMLYLLNADATVIQYTGDSAFDSVDQAREFIDNYRQYDQYGIGRCAVIDKRDDSFVGWCGLKFHATTDEYELGFRFFKKHWNQGYATETAKLWLDLAKNTLLIPKVLGRVHRDNKSSQQVLQKIGLQFHDTGDFDFGPGFIYKSIF